MADEMCDEAYRRESDDTQGILWPFCHHSENEANTLDRTELGEEKRGNGRVELGGILVSC